jgi:hypothetical protein
LIQQPGHVLDAALGDEITFQVMAIPFQSTGYHNTVGPAFKGVQYLSHVQLAGAGNFNDPHVGGVLESHGPGQVGGGVGAMLAGKSHDFRLKTIVLAQCTPPCLTTTTIYIRSSLPDTFTQGPAFLSRMVLPAILSKIRVIRPACPASCAALGFVRFVIEKCPVQKSVYPFIHPFHLAVQLIR